jgi:PncC family amidohydrolase
MGGIVSYQNEIKEKIVGVPVSIVEQFGVVSEQCAQAMAINVGQLFGADVSVSFTGNAGPDAMEGKPAGLVYTCLVVRGKVYPFCDQLDLPRNQLRQHIVDLTAERLCQLLANN